MLIPDGDALTLNLLHFPQEIVDHAEYALPSGKAGEYRINAREIDMAAKLIASMSVDWNPDDYKDNFRDKLRAIVEKLVEQQAGNEPEPDEDDAEVPTHSDVIQPDFMALLKQSIAAKRQSQKTGRATRSPARRRSTHKTPAKTPTTAGKRTH